MLPHRSQAPLPKTAATLIRWSSTKHLTSRSSCRSQTLNVLSLQQIAANEEPGRARTLRMASRRPSCEWLFSRSFTLADRYSQRLSNQSELEMTFAVA
jgi:hypothetical protein